MIKSLRRVILIVIVMLVGLTLPVFAREMTVDELGTEAIKYSSQASYVYVIGEYAFTSTHSLTTQDVMLAAKTITTTTSDGEKNSDGIYKKMAIQKITPKKEMKNGKITITGWKKDGDILKGGTTLGEKLNIRYIDYNYIKDVFNVTLSIDSDAKLPTGVTSPLKVTEGDKIDGSRITGNNRPTRPNYQFKEWVWDKSESEKDVAWNFSTDTVTKAITLKATWYNEVNTNKLLEESQSSITTNEFYGAKFDSNTNTILFDLYDLNVKNKTIKDNGLFTTIGNILKDEKITSLTVTYNAGSGEKKVTFNKSELPTGNVEDSEAYKNLKQFLKDITGKEEDNIVQGDLLGKELTLSVNVNSEDARSQNNKTEEIYTIKFVYDPKAKIENDLFAESIQDLKTANNYTFEKTYNVEEAEKGLYKVKGYITEQEGIKGFGTSSNKYYFAYGITIDEGVDLSKVKIKLPKKAPDSEETQLQESDYNIVTKESFTKIYNQISRELVVLMEVENEEKVKYRDIIIEIDEKPVKIRIDFTDLKLETSSEVTLSAISNDKITEGNGEWHKWTEKDGYQTTFSDVKSENGKNVVEVTGFIPLFTFESGENQISGSYDYYLGIKLTKKGQSDSSDKSTIVKFLDSEGNGEINKISKEDFGENNSIYLIKWVNPNRYETTKKFVIEVDFDDEGDTYAPYQITVDWSKLGYQQNSRYTLLQMAEANAVKGQGGYISETDKKQISDWGYDLDITGPYIQRTVYGYYRLRGNVKEQYLSDEAGFEEEKGYYVLIKIYGPSEIKVADNKKWTLELPTESGKNKKVTPSHEDYENGFITVLFKLKTGEEDKKKITYKIDWDGDEKNYVPYEDTIDYSELEFIPSSLVSVNLVKGEEDLKFTLHEGDKLSKKINETLLLKKGIDVNNLDYRTFEGWYEVKAEGEDTPLDDNRILKENEEINIKGYWKLDADAFIEDVVDDLNKTEGYDEKFELIFDEANNSITIDAKDPRVLLSEMNNTTIPGAIAYILQKEEIEDITLSTEGKEVTFTKTGANNNVVAKTSLDTEGEALKKKIQDGAKALFTEVLSDEEPSMTLSQMASKNKTFTLEIGESDKTATLVDSENKIYTFKFETEAAIVKSEEELKAALENEKITHIYLGNDFEVEKQQEIKRPVIINGEKVANSEKYKISVKDTNKESVDSIFKVASGDVTIENIELSNAKKAIIVDGEEVNLTTTGVTLSNITEEGIEAVKGNINVKKLTFDGETTEIPSIKVLETNIGNVKIEFRDSVNTSGKYNFINVKIHDEPWNTDSKEEVKDEEQIASLMKEKKISWSDEYTSTKDAYYYLKKENLKEYDIVMFMDKYWLTGGAHKLFLKTDGEKASVSPLKHYHKLTKELEGGTTVYFVGWSTTRGGPNNYDTLIDWDNEKVGDHNYYQAMYLERDESKKVTVEASVLGEEGDTSTYYTYKFDDKGSGMTIGELKKIDSDFAEMWKKLEAKKTENPYNQIIATKGESQQEATDATLIDQEVKLSLGTLTGVLGG